MIPCWRPLGPVDLGRLPEFAALQSWHASRLPIPPESDSVIAQVLTFFQPGAVADREPGCLAMVRPGESFPLHTDGQPSNWLTLVHVPVITTPGAWHLFADEPERVHFAAGFAYSFDSRRAHAYGNDGPGVRVHLIFDVVAG